MVKRAKRRQNSVMRIKIQLAVAVATLVLAGCASSSVKKTWKSPTYQGGPVKNVAVLAVDDRGMVRIGFENRFVRDFRERGQEATATHELLTLAEIKADKESAETRLRNAGADSVLIVRLVDSTTYANEVRVTPALFVPVVTGIDSSYGWYDYYSVAFVDMGTTWGNTETKVYLDTSLYDLKNNQRLWSTQTVTMVKEDSDRLAEVDDLVAKIVAALSKDGMVK